MAALDPGAKVADQLTVPVTHLNVDAWRSEPDDRRVVRQLFAEVGVEPVSQAVTFAVSVAAARIICNKLNLAIGVANEKAHNTSRAQIPPGTLYATFCDFVRFGFVAGTKRISTRLSSAAAIRRNIARECPS